MLSPRLCCILWNLIPGIGSTAWRVVSDRLGGLDAIARADAATLRAAGLSPAHAAAVAAVHGDEAKAQAELALAARHSARVIAQTDPEFPEPLRQIPDPPLVLYVRGDLRPEDRAAVAMVGARRASLYGLQCAARLSEELAGLGLTVVSGLALGIDGASHAGALRAGGRTIAVLGGGLARLYPRQHAELAEQVASNGAVISEYPMTMPSLPQQFPRRNRIISGLSLGVVVVEASSRSGSLITADCALEQGREVFAVPGPMMSETSRGTHRLVQQGAALVTCADDILEGLGWAPAPAGPPAQAGTDRILRAVPLAAAVHIDDIAAAAGSDIVEAAAALLDLELRGLVRQLPGKYFIRRTRPCASSSTESRSTSTAP